MTGAHARRDDGGTPPVDRALRAVVTVAVVAGVVARLLPRHALWLDEALSANIAGLHLGDIPDALRRDGHPPLYYFLLHLWIELGGDGDWWVRFLSGLLSLLGLPLAWLAGRRLGRRPNAHGLGSERTGLIAVAVWAVAPFGIRYATETRMYALVATLAMAGYLLVDDLLSPPPRADDPMSRAWPRVVGLALVTAALLYSHYWSIWLAASTGLLALGVAIRSLVPARRRRAWLAVGALAAGGVLFLPWLPTMAYQSEHTGTPWGEVFRPATILVVSFIDFVGGPRGELQLLSYGVASAVLVAVFGRLRRRSGREVIELGSTPQPRIAAELAVMLLTYLIGWAVSAVSGATFASRYAAVVLPLFVLVTAGGLAMARRRATTTAVVGLIVAGMLLGVAIEIPSDRTQAGVVADAVADDLAGAAGARGGPAVVLTCPDQLAPATERAVSRLDLDARVVPFPGGGDPRFVDWVDYAERNEAADPAAFAAEVLEGLGDTPVYVVATTGYRTLEGTCEALLAAATQRTGASATQLVTGDGERFYEPMSLWALRTGD